MSERAAPFHCPYCGEQTIRPFGELDDPHGQWRCDSCRRAFRLRMIGLTRTDTTAPAQETAREEAQETPADTGEQPR